MRRDTVFILCAVFWFRDTSTRYIGNNPQGEQVWSELPDEDMLLFWKEPNSPRCEPFKTFFRKCNKCVCGADKIVACTRLKCLLKPDYDIIDYVPPEVRNTRKKHRQRRRRRPHY